LCIVFCVLSTWRSKWRWWQSPYVICTVWFTSHTRPNSITSTYTQDLLKTTVTKIKFLWKFSTVAAFTLKENFLENKENNLKAVYEQVCGTKWMGHKFAATCHWYSDDGHGSYMLPMTHQPFRLQSMSFEVHDCCCFLPAEHLSTKNITCSK